MELMSNIERDSISPLQTKQTSKLVDPYKICSTSSLYKFEKVERRQRKRLDSKTFSRSSPRSSILQSNVGEKGVL